ncbi:hypothetical protein IWW36_000982 [Coemansia brasiliensis]|uniref:Phytanoyl-CoA dioxygenase n=1 Tax=Coemansia brasiliensis TaxID=2650707 RepID=A0A9W8IHQ9_9FUNG|nr:hypothetical protein IWW36_000982 [Coemansia brasiliensis]
MFTDTHKEAFSRDGYVVVEDFLSKDQVQELRQHIQQLLTDFNPQDHPLTTFPTTTDNKLLGNQYFFDSATRISYFLETDSVAQGKLSVEPAQAINKIGHGLHIQDPVFKQLTHSSHVREIADKLGFKDPRVLQSMVICKQPRIGGPVPMHQDSTFLFTDPPSACGFWIALEDCLVTNGCLYVVPTSHRSHAISRRMVRCSSEKHSHADEGVDFVDIEPVFSLYPLKGEQEEQQEQPESCPVEVKAGSLVLLHGQLLHMSPPNHSDKSRWIYTFHIIEGMHKYDLSNWLQMPADFPLTKL